MDKQLLRWFINLFLTVSQWGNSDAQAPLPAPTILTISSPTPTSITLTWEQTEGADAVDSYEIRYEFSVNECSHEVGIPPSITVLVNNGSLRRYTLTDSPSTPVEADSTFFITLTTVSNVTRSDPTPPVQVMTADTAPGAPQSLRIASVDVTNITIQWDRVDCLERNGRTDSYLVIYYPTSNPNGIQAVTVFGTGDSDRMFSLPGLPPRTSYTFQIEAINPLIRYPGVLATINVSTTTPQSIGFLLAGRLYPNNSVVTLTDIGNRFFGPPLYCLTSSTECCSSSVSGEWYLPDGTPVSSSTTPFSRYQVPNAVNLFCNVLTPPTGVFRCEIPDSSGTRQDIYVGIYPEGIGSPFITSVVFDRNSTTLTCTSTGGPPTTVTWRKNGVLVNESLYEQSQRLMDAQSATYENVLFNDDVSNLVSTFTCAVSNVRGSVEETVELNGVSITHDLFIVGQLATVRCISNNAATRMEWLNAEDVLITSATSTQQLDLVFSLVNDSIHDQVYVCRVIRNGGVIATQNFTMDLFIPSTVVNITVSSAGTTRAGMVYELTCTVSKTVDGLINSPTATWTTAGGVAVSNGIGITVFTMAASEIAISILTFDPLRTSHEGIYRCDGTLTSPALNTPLMPSTWVIHEVQISTPAVDITLPPGPLFAGSTTPLTLTCTISINPATDTDVSVTADMDVTWLRGTTALYNSDTRVTISPIFGSQPSFISTLTLDPLSTFDNTTFTCQARARPPANQQSFITASEVGDTTISVIINSPSPPSVIIAPSSIIVVAGQPFTRTCSASVQDGISGTPTLIWTRNGIELSGEGSSGSLSFSPLRTSHGGVYTCTARLTIPEAGVDVSGTDTITIVVQIPSPTLTTGGSPRDTGFFQGLILTLTCLIEIDPVVDTPVTVQGSWKRNGTSLENSSDGRITVINTGLAESPYQTQVRFNSTDFEDAGTYNCSARIIPQNSNLVLEANVFITQVITVLNFPPQTVTVTDEGVSTAGFSGYTLICNTNREQDLPSSSTLMVQWLGPDGNTITTGNGFTIIGTQGPSNDITLTSRLTFSNLLTSQAGLYTCRTLLTIPGTAVDHTVEHNFAVTVKLPAPAVVTIQGSRGAPVYEGTTFSLTCLITSNMTGVDTDVIVQRNFTGPGTSATNRVTQEDIELQTTLMFCPVAMTDDGRYVCSASAVSTPQYPYVDASDVTVNDTTIEISILRLPAVSITSPPPTAAAPGSSTSDNIIGGVHCKKRKV